LKDIDEIKRIKAAYKKRDISGKRKLYSLFNPAYLFISQQRERAILNVLSRSGLPDLSRMAILDVGCGNGSILRDFVRYGTMPEQCFGIDLLLDRIDEAKNFSTTMDFSCGNAESLPYDNAIFDIVLCFTVFTSILDKTMKQNIAKEMLRVLKTDGIILWYDYHKNNPKNSDVRGVKKKDIYKLFPDCKIYLKRITLAPPLARAIAPYSYLACYLLENLKIFNTHYIGIIKRF
jgi:ubiquinone/menaquinone biosynthesis C-methylase UbiE